MPVGLQKDKWKKLVITGVAQSVNKSLAAMLHISCFSNAASEVCLAQQGFSVCTERLTPAFAQQYISSPSL